MLESVGDFLKLEHATLSLPGKEVAALISIIYIERCSYESISHLTMRDKVGALTFKLLALNMNVRASTLSLI